MLLAVSQNLDIENEIIPHIAVGFGGGIGHTGDVCGALSGGVLAIGLIKGPAENSREMQDIQATVREFTHRFKTEMGSIYCRELTEGADLATAEGLEKFQTTDKPKTVCLPASDIAHKLVTELLNNTD